MKFSSILGPIWLDADETSLTQVSYSEIPETAEANQAILLQAKDEIIGYLAGERIDFSVPIKFLSGTLFQQAAWRELQTIPYGETRSYQEQATNIDRPKAVRAIGQANRNNPLAIIVPCHRVLGKNGQLTGYSGSGEKGLAIKAQLLKIEKSRES